MLAAPDFDFVDALEEILVAVVAIEPVRAAGAALVHEDDVAIAAHALERAGGRGVQIHRRSAGTARDQEQRIGLLVEADGRYARDEQFDGAAPGLVRIFGNAHARRIRRSAPACAPGCSRRQGLSVSGGSASAAAQRRRSREILPGRKVASCGAQDTRSRAAPGIQSRLRRVREMKRAVSCDTCPSASAVLRSVAILGVVLLAIDAARLLIRFVLQMSTFAPGHHAVGLGAPFDAIQVHLAGGEAAGLAHASARRSPRRCGCAGAGCARARR